MRDCVQTKELDQSISFGLPKKCIPTIVVKIVRYAKHTMIYLHRYISHWNMKIAHVSQISYIANTLAILCARVFSDPIIKKKLTFNLFSVLIEKCRELKKPTFGSFVSKS